MTWHGGNWGWMALMMGFGLAFWVGVIFLIVWLVRNWDRGPATGQGPTADKPDR